MENELNLTKEFATLSKTVRFSNFYSINVWINSKQISLQGNFNPENVRAAKELGVNLEFDNETNMLRGVSEDGKYRIVLT